MTSLSTYRALIVCNSYYPEDTANLGHLYGPRVDALLMWRALTDRATGVVPEDEVEVLHERTSAEIADASGAFYESAGKYDTLIWYFSGHGRWYGRGRELVFCARDTTANNLVGTGVPASHISMMIRESDAAQHVVILDCCHGGGFKGGDDISGALAGFGRYVLSAATGTDLADDAKVPRQGSPFTIALTQAMGNAAAIARDKSNADLEDLYDHLRTNMPSNGLRPHKDFSGTGSVVLSRASGAPPARGAARGGTSAASAPMSQATDARGVSMAAHTVGNIFLEPSLGSTPATRRARKPGDVSHRDLYAWLFALAASVTLVAAGGYSFFNWPYAGIDPDAHGYIAIVVAAIGLVLVGLSVFEGASLRRAEYPQSQRDLLVLFERRPLTQARHLRTVLSCLGALAIPSGLLGFDNSAPSWLVALACVGVLFVASLAQELRIGDTAILASATVLLTAPFLPYSFFDPDSTPFPVVVGIVILLGATAVLIAWLLQLTLLWVVVPLALTSLIMFALSSARNLTIAPWVAVTAICLTWLSVLLSVAADVEAAVRRERAAVAARNESPPPAGQRPGQAEAVGDQSG